MSFLTEFDDANLTAEAQSTNPRLKRWVSQKGGGTRRTYVCNLCGETIDTESAGSKPTVHSATAIEGHKQQHLEGKL